MPTPISNEAAQHKVLQRKFYGRSRRSCFACRSKHRRCDGAAKCKRCVATETECIYPIPARAMAITANPQTMKGGELFYRIVVKSQRQIAQAGFSFWKDYILPASQTHDAILDGVLCFSTLGEQPLQVAYSSAGLRARAIQWYCSSLAKPITDLPLLLMASTLYLQIEHRLGHYQNLDSLLQSTFALIHASKDQLRNRQIQNIKILTSIPEALNAATIASCANSTLIPRAHWETAVTQALWIAAQQGDLSVQVPLTELYNIIYDINLDGTDLNIGFRMQSWTNNIEKFISNPDEDKMERAHLEACKRGMSQNEISWRFQQWWSFRKELDFDYLRISLSKALISLESVPSWRGYPVYAAAIRTCVFLAWHSREPEYCRRIKDVLRKWGKEVSYLDRILQYIDTLQNFEHGKPTALEIEVFGPNPPSVLTRWQLWRLANRIAISESVV